MPRKKESRLPDLPGSALAPARDRLGLQVGAFIVVVVVGIYAWAWANSASPAGHPLTGLMWAMIAYMTLRRATRESPGPRLMYWITLGLAVVGAVMWTAATWIQMNPRK